MMRARLFVRRLLGALIFGSGSLLIVGIAVTLTILLPSFYREWNPGGTSGYVGLPSVFLVVEPLVVVVAWVAVWAWFRRRWIITGLCLLAAVFGPWGINVSLAVIPILLGVAILVVGASRRIVRATRGLVR